MDATRSEESTSQNGDVDTSDDDSPWEKIDSCLGVEVFTHAVLDPPDQAPLFGLRVELNDHRKVGIRVSSLERVAEICAVIKAPSIHLHCDESEDGEAMRSMLRSLISSDGATSSTREFDALLRRLSATPR
jgi:hypothetical protein